MRVYKGSSYAEAYKNALQGLRDDPEYDVSPRGQRVKEIQDVSIEVEDPSLCLFTNERRSSQLKYIAAELLYYFSGRNDVGFISKYAKLWETIANPNGTVNSAYGTLLFRDKNEYDLNQWEWAYQSLAKDKDTRQAVMFFNKPTFQFFDNKDFVCTLNGVFSIRDNKLNFTVQMRSNDAVLGTATDDAFFCLLQLQMLKQLKENVYPDLELGTYTHIVHSLHIYERHFDLVDEMLEYKFEPMSFPSIREFFITPQGHATSILKELEQGIETEGKSDLRGSKDDPLFNWIINQIL